VTGSRVEALVEELDDLRFGQELNLCGIALGYVEGQYVFTT
jgi:hypothetical protein